MSFASKRVVSWGVLAFLAVACAPEDAVFEQRRQGISEWTGSLATARWNHTATLLNTGKVLVSGGEISTSVFNSAELYDPATGTWSATGAMVARRSHHIAVLLNDGRVLVAGGYNTATGSAQVLSSAEIYNPATGTWSATASMHFPRYWHAAVTLLDGRVLVAGGFYSINTTEQRSSEIYDPATGTWSDVPNVMTSTRRGHSLIRLSTGNVLVVGGQAWNGATDTSFSVEMFDPASMSWSPRGNAIFRHVNGAAELAGGDKVLQVGGSGGYSLTADLYDPATQYGPQTGSPAAERAFFTLTRFDAGRILAVGGGDTGPTTTAIESYDIATGTWSTISTLRQAREMHTATLLPGPTPRLLIVGGTAQNQGAFASAEIYSDGPDVTPPATSMTYPLAGYTLSQTPTLSANATDNVGVTRVEFYRDNVLLGSSTGPYYTLSWNTTTVPNGSYTLSTKAYDAAGNVGTSAGVPITVNNDLTPPTTTLTAPAAGAVLSLTATLTANASDNASVSRVEFYRDGVLIGTDTTSPYSINWDTTLVPNGSYTLTSKAYDPTGNSASSAGVAVTVSNETVPPTTTLTSPAAGSTLSMTVTLTADASDNVGVTKVEFYRDSTLIGTATSAPYSVSWNTRSVANGSYTLTSKAYDAARNTGTSVGVAVTVSNDVTAPTASITSPAANAVVSGTVTIAASASDNVGVTQVEFYRSGVLLGTSTAAPYTFSWNTTQVVDGAYSLTVKAYDATGNAGTSAAVPVTVNNAGPGSAMYDATLRAPKCGSVVASCTSNTLLYGRANLGPEPNQPNTINGSCADGTSGTYHTDESLDALRVATTDGSNFATGKTVRIDATVWAYSSYSSDKLDLYYAADATAPNWIFIATLSPTVAGSQTLSTTYTLPSGGNLQAIRGVFRYGGSASPCSTGGFDDRDDLVFAVNATPADSVAPTASITSPASGATLSGTVTISANASDNVGVTRVDFYQGSTLIASDTTAPYSVSWSTGAVANGTYTLTAKAYDAAGNVGTSAGVTVTVSNTAGLELISNGGFEGSVSPWVIAGQSTYVAGGSYPHGGTGYNELGNADNAAATTEQTITLASGSAPQLTFWLNVTTTESTSSTTQWDKLFIEVVNTSGTLLGTLGTFSNLDYGTAGVYSQKSYSLAPYAGQTLKVRFRATTDGSLPSIFRIDDVSVK